MVARKGVRRGPGMAEEPPDLRSSRAAENARGGSGGLEKRLLRAAEAGDADSQCNLGILYDNGLDDNGRLVDRNKRQALRWLSAAAEQGLARAQARLAEIYAEGPDLCGDHVAACGWFLLAAGGLHGIHQHR